MRKALISVALMATMLLSGCQSWTRSFGGTMTIDLPAGERLETAYWDGSKIDYQTHKRHPDEKPETHILHESSNYHIAQSTVYFVEH